MLLPPEESLAIVRYKGVLHSKFFHRGKKNLNFSEPGLIILEARIKRKFLILNPVKGQQQKYSLAAQQQNP